MDKSADSNGQVAFTVVNKADVPGGTRGPLIKYRELFTAYKNLTDDAAIKIPLNGRSLNSLRALLATALKRNCGEYPRTRSDGSNIYIMKPKGVSHA